MMMFILGMLAWQIVTTVVYFATGEDDEKGTMCGSGVCVLVLMGVYTVIHKIRLHNSRKYNLYQFFGHDGVYITNYYMTEQDAERFNLIDRNADPSPYCVRLICEGKEFKNSPSACEILTTAMIDNGIAGMSKDYFEKFFKRA